jgi:hypothetical protein
MPKLAFASAVKIVARHENGTELESVLQAGIKKPDIDVPGLIFDY